MLLVASYIANYCYNNIIIAILTKTEQTDKLIQEVIALNDHFNPSLVEGQDELCIAIYVKLKVNC